MKKIAILGSRDLSCKITKWIHDSNLCHIIGVLPPPFKGWWNDKLKETCEELNLKTYASLDDILKLKPDFIPELLKVAPVI